MSDRPDRVLPSRRGNARAAQAAGLLLWFVLLQLGGAGPPNDVITQGMRTFGEFTPM